MTCLRVVCIVLLGVVIFCSKPAEATELFSFVDERGVIHLTDRPRDSRYRLIRFGRSAEKQVQRARIVRLPVVNDTLVRPISRPSQPSKRTVPPPEWRKVQYDPIISAAARRNGLSSALLRSVIRAESNFDPNAVSPKGAVGLMQLMPDTARMVGVWDSTDPEANIHGGARFLAKLLKRFDNDLELSLAAYNAGPETVVKYGRAIPPYPETQRYVDRVLRYYREYRQTM